MDVKYRELIANKFRNYINNTITRISTNAQTYRPFHTALPSFWNGFEPSFSTSFGQRVIEELARLVALFNGTENTKRQKETCVTIDFAYENAIRKHIQSDF